MRVRVGATSIIFNNLSNLVPTWALILSEPFPVSCSEPLVSSQSPQVGGGVGAVELVLLGAGSREQLLEMGGTLAVRQS